MDNMTERIGQLNDSMKIVREEFKRLDRYSKEGWLPCAVPLLSAIHEHKVMRLKFLLDIEKDFVIPSGIMGLAGAGPADYTFVDGGCFQKEV